MIHNVLLTTRFRKGIVSLYLKENRIDEIHYSCEDSKYQIGDIYVAKVIYVAKNLNAAFVEISPGVKGFLPFDKVKNPIMVNREYDGRVLEQDEIVVQIEKAAVKTKEAVVTTMLNLVNPYFVISLNNTKIGYSSELTKENKAYIKNYLSAEMSKDFILKEDGHLQWKEEFGLVFRTEWKELLKTGVCEHLQSVLDDFLLPYVQRMKDIVRFSKHRTCYTCLYQEKPAYLKWLYRVNPDEIDAFVTDDQELFQQLSKSLEPDLNRKLKLYQDEQISLRALYGLDSKINELLSKNVWLKSGGYLVIEQTEALTVIDVNTGKNISSKSKEDIVRLTNTEAAKEAMRQIKLRNISGIIIIDFINNDNKEEMSEIIKLIKQEAKRDFAKPAFMDITALGLVELTRRKIEKNLKEALDINGLE